MSTSVAPPGWPHEVRPPGAPEWERTATAWLLDQCPPEYRGHRAVAGEPLVLARATVLHVEAAQDGVRRALSQARASLRGHVDPDALEAAIVAWLSEDARLTGVRRAAGLVEEALRGRRFAPQL